MRRSPWFSVAGAWLVGLALWQAPETFQRRVHAATADALRPAWCGIRLVESCLQQMWLYRRDAEWQRLQTELNAVRLELNAEKERVHRLAAQLAQAREPGVMGLSPAQISAEERLFVPALVEAGVLGDTLSQAWRDGRILDRGWKHGVRETALVLQGKGPLIDLGAAAQIAPEDPLLIGRAIVGKVAIVGRWTSIYLPVTDPAYRGRAQLVRETELGPHWGCEGLLRGGGDGRCRLDGIPVEQAVRAGDLVYSAERDGALEAPLVYGRVIEARASPDDREWTVIVEPAPQPSRLTTVHVLRAALNPGRFWGN